MHYLILLPSLLTALPLCAIDLREHRVPRATVGLGYLSQSVVLLLAVSFGLTGSDWSALAGGVGASLASGSFQALLCLCAPKAIGLGDATFTALASLGLGFFHGLEGVCLSWLLTGGLGCLALTAVSVSSRSPSPPTRPLGHTGLAFVPVITAGTVLTYLVYLA